MNSIIIDTSAFISLENLTDSNYSKAQKISKKIQKHGFSVVVPGDIFTETMNTVGKKINHKAAIIQAEKILASKKLIIAETTSHIRERALDKFKKQPESVSFTDCLVMAFADEYETKDVFGFDESFRKNGYRRIGIDG